MFFLILHTFKLQKKMYLCTIQFWIMNDEIDILLSLYRGLVTKRTKAGIPVTMRPKDIVGTVQDDPFDCWIAEQMKEILPPYIEIFHSGKLTTPDIVIRNNNTGSIIGLEIKKLIQRAAGKDPRGLTMDYNSSLPCGRAFVKTGGETIIVPCYYLFALLSPKSDNIITLIIVDGDFINYDFELYKEAKYSNYTEYGHGPYAEGSVRHRKMYTYPNLLNSNIKDFFQRYILIVKKNLVDKQLLSHCVPEFIIRSDKYGNSFYFSVLDETTNSNKHENAKIITNIFDACKKRTTKERVAYIPEIPTR